MYSKENCSLCDKAKAILEDLQTEFSFDIEEIDIYKDDHLLELYQIKIPVIVMDGEEIEFGIIHKDVIRKRFLK
ncbi:glutaredoxin family protein [Bacillus sp. HMF5848]|uniref:glutaredoxin family protein n=1 Tax=Bacillus sp. HMF5848 TaxID=2495421 RepID=UPI000F76A4EE|nr:glutaredoxin family protein [Bacillus sp. HMF5848]RSK29436.1 glutaredoxin family protein [Bacillus sp. HMF5848]